MTSASHFRYSIEYLDDAGASIDQLPVDPDWIPAREWAHFRSVRSGARSATGSADAARIEPVFDSTLGAPVVSAVRVVLPACAGGDGTEVCEEIPSLVYFRSPARAGSAELVERGALATGEPYRFRVCAWLAEALPDLDDGSLPLTLETAPEPIEIDTRTLASFARRAEPASCVDDGELPVFVPRQILEQAEARARQAGNLESGGMLVGKLHRDPGIPDVFLEVTGLIPAAHAEAERLRLTFKPETWSQLRDAMRLRAAGEVLCGWQHAHPRFCSGCPPESRATCVWSRPFFSGEDVHMHRTIFAQGFHVALLTSDLGAESLDHSLFGWNRGVVSPRGFHVLD